MIQTQTQADDLIQVRVIVSGKVQGVGFRISTAHEASRYHSIHGYVRNLPDGRVEAVFSGPKHEVNLMLQWCKKGPIRARVTQVDTVIETYEGKYLEFKVLT